MASKETPEHNEFRTELKQAVHDYIISGIPMNSDIYQAFSRSDNLDLIKNLVLSHEINVKDTEMIRRCGELLVVTARYTISDPSNRPNGLEYSNGNE